MTLRSTRICDRASRDDDAHNIDGDLDLTNVDIVGKNPSAASLLWFENDGDIDAASAGYVSGKIAWHENPGPDGRDREWPKHVIDTTLTVRDDCGVIDADGDFDPAATAWSHGAGSYDSRIQAIQAENG